MSNTVEFLSGQRSAVVGTNTVKLLPDQRRQYIRAINNMDGLTNSEKEQIAMRGATLQERLNFPLGNRSSGDKNDLVVQWREYVANGNTAIFDARLDRDSLTVDECERLVSQDEWPFDEELPEWVDELSRLVAFIQSAQNSDLFVNPPTDIAFSHLLVPVASYADKCLSNTTTTLLTETARTSAMEYLINQLSSVASHVLFIEFKTYVKTDACLVDEEMLSSSKTGHYDDFVVKMCEDIDSLFLEYSFLGRLVVTMVKQWVAMLDELAKRVVSDIEALHDQFSIAEVETVADIDILGEPHPEGRYVIKVIFNCGDSVAYKPRNSGIAAGFRDFLEWLNENSSLPRLTTAKILCRSDYSWMEWIDPSECSMLDNAARYYRRAGCLIFLFYATNVVDMHIENIVADGIHPVVIDLETIAHPELKPDYQLTERKTEDRETILRTGAVPKPVASDNAEEIACFATNEIQFTSNHYEFDHINTDGMELSRNKEVVATTDNLPIIDGNVIGPSDYAQEIVDGFEEAYQFVLKNRVTVLKPDGPLKQLCDRESYVRVLYRSNQNYSALRRILTHQPNLKTGLQFGVKVESLAAPILERDVHESAWEVFEQERDALHHWNCPQFTARLDDTDLYYEGETVIQDALERKPIEDIERRIRGLSETDLERQKAVLRDCFGK